MTKPHSGDADENSDQPEGESAAVRVRTDAASERDTAKAETSEPVEGEATEPKDTEDTAGAQDTGEADAAISDDAEVEQKPQGIEAAKAKRRIGRLRARAHSVNGRRGGQGLQPRLRGVTKPHADDAGDRSDQRDEKSVEGEAKDTSDATAPAGAQDSGEAEAAISDDAEAAEKAEGGEPAKAKRRISWSRVLAYGVLPGLALLLAVAAGFSKWQDSSARASQSARIDSVAAAKDSTIALLSYQSATVEKDLEAAKNRLTGTFKESYSQLINDVVIPGSKREHISTTATVPAAASVSATPNHAVTLLFVNQTAVIDKSAPSDTASSVRVTLDKIAGRWLISGFDPV
jgi:Mce-associated membrane protein